MSSVTIAEFVQHFRNSGQKVPHVVYDVDDTLWDLIGRVAERNHISRTDATAVFSIRHNKHLTPTQQDIVIAAFSDPAIFENIQFFDGATDILRPCELGARVTINSNSFNTEIAELKRQQLLATIPGLSPEDIQMNIIDYGTTHRKEFVSDMTILVDDSPHNVSLSPALLNIMPMTVRWTWCSDALHMVAEKPVMWQTDLTAINQMVYNYIRAIMSS